MENIYYKEYTENNLSYGGIAKKYHKSPKTIKKILVELGVKISNKPKNYWKNKDNVFSAAKTCKNIREFSQKYSGAYFRSKENGWLEELSTKYFTNGIQYKGTEEKIHMVYAYEFPNEHMVYVGRTMDLKRRDYSHRKATYGDSLNKFVNDKKLVLPEPKILEDNLTGIESKESEGLWVNKYSNEGWGVINKAKTGITSSSLGATPRKWTYETCRSLAETCRSKEEFKKKSSRAHNVSRKEGWIDEFFPQQLRGKNGYFDSLTNCKKTIMDKNFKSLSEIRDGYPFLYKKICIHNWNDEIRKMLKYEKYRTYRKKEKREE